MVLPDDRTDIKNRADALLAKVKADVDRASLQIEEEKARLADRAVLTQVDNDRIDALKRQLAEAEAYHEAITKRLAKKGNTLWL